MSELAICYEPERLIPKKKTLVNFEKSTTETFYIPRRTVFNLDFKIGRKHSRATIRTVKKREFVWKPSRK